MRATSHSAVREPNSSEGKVDWRGSASARPDHRFGGGGHREPDGDSVLEQRLVAVQRALSSADDFLIAKGVSRLARSCTDTEPVMQTTDRAVDRLLRSPVTYVLQGRSICRLVNALKLPISPVTCVLRR